MFQYSIASSEFLVKINNFSISADKVRKSPESADVLRNLVNNSRVFAVAFL